jgi:hypothetical protein
MTTASSINAPPIVFVQRGLAFYFPTVLVQAARRCVSSQIHLISDVDPASFLPGDARARVAWVPSSTLDHAADDFRRHYVHLSVNRPWLEQLCFERWFMIRELCRLQSLTSIIHLDSDVLVESDVGRHLAHRTGQKVMFSRRMGPHVAYFRDIAQLDNLCEDILSTYRSPERLTPLRQLFATVPAHGQARSISDMFFFEQLASTLGNDYGDTFQVVDGQFFDHCMGMVEGYRSRLGTKVVSHRGDSAYCRSLSTGERVRALALHFQGVTKIWMAWHADVGNLRDARRSLGLWCRGVISYASRAHRYVIRKFTGLSRRLNTQIKAR